VEIKGRAHKRFGVGQFNASFHLLKTGRSVRRIGMRRRLAFASSSGRRFFVPSFSSILVKYSTMQRSAVLALLVAAMLLAPLAQSACPSASYVDAEAVDVIPSSPAITQAAPANLITQSAELVTVYKPAGPDANPRTNCPWRRSGLKNWHDPATWGGSVPAVRRIFTKIMKCNPPPCCCLQITCRNRDQRWGCLGATRAFVASSPFRVCTN